MTVYAALERCNARRKPGSPPIPLISLYKAVERGALPCKRKHAGGRKGGGAIHVRAQDVDRWCTGYLARRRAAMSKHRRRLLPAQEPEIEAAILEISHAISIRKAKGSL